MSELGTAPEGAGESASAPTEQAAPETAAPESGSTPEAPSTSADPDSELRGIWRKMNPARDEKGKFTSQNESEREQDFNNDESVNSDQAQPEATETPKQESIPMPQSWSAEVTALWEKAPPELKAHIAKREAEVHQAITTQGQKLKSYEPIAQLVEQNRRTFDKYGVDPKTGINQLIAANDYLERDPVNAIRDLAKAYGVEHAFSGQPGSTPVASPETAALKAEIDRLNARLQQTDNRLVTREQQDAERHLQSIESTVAKFAEDKPDFTELADDVEEQILAIRTRNPHLSALEVLQKAYERARRVNPTVSARIEAEQKQAAEKKRIEEAKKRAAEAKKAAPLNVASSPANSSNPRSVDDTLRSVARKAYRGS